MYTNYVVCKCGNVSFVNGKSIISPFNVNKTNDSCAGCTRDLSEYLTIVRPQNGVYTGDWVNGRRHGYGSIKSATGIYTGQWKDNHAHGRGIYHWNDGTYYVGEWYYGNMQGHGLLFLPGKEFYFGDFKRSRFCGEGIAYYADGTTLVGKWINNRRIIGASFDAEGNRLDLKGGG